MGFAGTGKIWMNGKLVDWADAKIHVASHVIHYGSAVFEGIRCYDTPKGSAIFRLGPHMRRLMDSAKIYRMEYALGQAELEQAVVETIRANELEGLLHPAHHLPGLRGARRQSVPLPGGRVHHRVGVGRLPGQRRAREGRGRRDQLVEPRRAEHVPVAREDGRQLRQLAADQDAVARGRLRRGHRARHQRLPERGQRPEPVPRPRRRALHAARRATRSCRASRATRS